MKIVQITISDTDYKKYFRKKVKASFNDLKEKILTASFQQSLDKSVRLARKNGLSKMSLKEINAEIGKVRKRA
jgi:hypothetical protein